MSINPSNFFGTPHVEVLHVRTAPGLYLGGLHRERRAHDVLLEDVELELEGCKAESKLHMLKKIYNRQGRGQDHRK